MCGWEWFPNNKGVVSGFIIGGFGFGSFIFGFITTHIVNPNNVRPRFLAKGDTEKLYDNDITQGVPYMYHVCLAIWAGISLMSVICVFRNPDYAEDTKHELQDDEISTEEHQEEKQDD